MDAKCGTIVAVDEVVVVERAAVAVVAIAFVPCSFHQTNSWRDQEYFLVEGVASTFLRANRC